MRVLIGITAAFLLSMPVAAIFVPWMFATSLANKHLKHLVSDAQRVASTVLKELEVLSEPVLEAADDSKLQGLLKSDGVQRLLKYVKTKPKGNIPFSDQELQRLLKGDDLQCLQAYVNKLLSRQNVKSKGNRYFDYYSIYIQKDGFILGVFPISIKNISIIGNDYSGRDYYIGAMNCRREKGKASFHISRVFQAENDNNYKFAISAPVYENANPGSDPLGVIAAAIATTPTLGSLQLDNPWLTAVLVNRGDPNQPRGPHAPGSEPPEYLIVVHPAYLYPVNKFKVNNNSLRFPPKQPPMNPDYRDPLATQHKNYRGRMLAGFAPVGNTELLVIVQQRYDEAIEEDVTLARGLILGGGIFLSLGAIITGAIMGYGVPIATEKKTTNLA